MGEGGARDARLEENSIASSRTGEGKGIITNFRAGRKKNATSGRGRTVAHFGCKPLNGKRIKILSRGGEGKKASGKEGPTLREYTRVERAPMKKREAGARRPQAGKQADNVPRDKAFAAQERKKEKKKDALRIACRPTTSFKKEENALQAGRGEATGGHSPEKEPRVKQQCREIAIAWGKIVNSKTTVRACRRKIFYPLVGQAQEERPGLGKENLHPPRRAGEKKSSSISLRQREHLKMQSPPPPWLVKERKSAWWLYKRMKGREKS